MAQDLDKSPSTPFDLVYDGPTLGWQKIYGSGGGSASSAFSWVNAADFPGFVGDGSVNTAPAIQAAIDFAFAHNISTVVIPEGANCYITETIWVDPPGNMRVSGPASPTMFQFSMALIGGNGNSNDIFDGVTFYATTPSGGFCDFPVIVVGPGQGMRVEGISIQGNGSLYNTTFPATSIGIAISGGNGGASRTLIARCGVQNMYCGIRTGWNSDALADSNTFYKCFIDHCRLGIDIAQTQNYINEVIACSINFCSTALFSSRGKAVNVFGGNFSAPQLSHRDFTVGSTSALSSGSGSAGTYLKRFTTVVTIPGDPFAENAFTDGGTCVYTAFSFVTAKYGIILCRFVSYDANTNTLTLDIDDDWVFGNWGFQPNFAITALQAELQAVTTMTAADVAIVFYGTGIKAYGTHVENPVTCTQLVNCATSFQGAFASTLYNIYLNADPLIVDGGSLDKLQSVLPFLRAAQADIFIHNGFEGSNLSSRPYTFYSTGAFNIHVSGISIFNPSLLVGANMPTFGYIGSTPDVWQSMGQGTGVFKEGPWTQDTSSFSGAQSGGFIRYGRGKPIETWGRFPAPGLILEMDVVYYSNLSTVPPTGNKGTTGYPAIMGRQMYRVTDFQNSIGSLNHSAMFMSNHDFYSWGQNLAVNWSYRGGSNCVYITGGADAQFLFPGLKIGLDNGSGTVWYLILTRNVVGGYITVCQTSNVNPPLFLVGSTATTFTGATIFQESYDIVQYGIALTQPLVTLTDAATVAVDLSTGINFSVTLGGNRTLGNPTKTTVGQQGTIEVIQDGTGGRTLAFDTNYKFQSASAPSLNAAVGAKTILNYFVENSTNIWISGGYQPSTSNSMQTALVTSQFDVTNNNTLADVPGLSATLLANRKYRGRAVLSVNVNATPGMKIGMSGTAGINSSNFFAHAIPFIGGATISNAQVKTGTFGQITSGNSGFTVIQIDYFIDVSTAGTLTIQFSQGTSGATTVSVLVGSTMVTTLI